MANRKNAMINRTTRKSALGKRGERFAADFYRSRGADVIAANVNYAVGEIDLIVRENNVFVFVEVKTRTSANYGIAEAVTPRKLIRMRKAAVQWLDGKPLSEVRFDVIALLVKGNSFDLEHFEAVS
jgi:putative endonuclease